MIGYSRSMPATSHRALTAFAAVLVIVSAGLAAADVVIGPWDRDGGFYLLKSLYTAQGLRPYIDYKIIYPPLMTILNAPLVALPVGRLPLAIAIPIAWILANALATAWLFYVITKSRALSLAGAALFMVYSVENGGNHLTLEHGVVFFSCLTLALALDGQAFTPRRLALVGLTASAACLCKQNGVVVLLPLAVILIAKAEARSPRQAAAFATGFAALPLALLAWLGFHVRSIVSNLFTDVVGYAGATLPDTGWRNELGRAPATVALFTIIAVLAAVMALRWRDLRFLSLAALAGAILEFLPRMIRNYPHYNLTIWPFLALVLALALSRAPVRYAALIAGSFACAVLVYALTLSLQRFQSTDSSLLGLETAALTVRSVTPAGGVVRQYGAEPIIEFLAGLREEKVDKAETTWSRWDGRGVYRMPPPPDATVVVIDRGQAWTATVLRQLDASGFTPVVGRTPSDFDPRVGRIRILRKTR